MTESVTTPQAPPTFYDSANWRDIPHDSDAALYGDGDFAAPENAPELLNLRETRIITVTGDWRKASIVDYEKMNPVYFPAGLRGFVRGRRSISEDAIVYCNESTAREAIAALHDSGFGELLDYPRLYWWIATLDNYQRSAQTLVNQLAALWDAPQITEANLWANQYGQLDDNRIDVSNRFLPWRP